MQEAITGRLMMAQETTNRCNNPIRVLCVFSTLDRGGAETMCMNLYRHINREKIQFDFVKHTPKEGAYEKEIQALGGKIYEAPRYKIYNHLKYCRWWKKHFNQHPEHRIIHGHFFTISAVYFKIAKKEKRITVGHSHCTPADKRNIKEILSIYYCKKMDKYSDARLACSQGAGEWIYKKNFIVFNNAIETSEFLYDLREREAVRKVFNMAGRFVIGAVGRIMHQKNPFGIIEIFRATHAVRPEALLMWIGDGPLRKEAERRVKEYGIQDDVLFLGVRSDVPKLMQAMDAFIFPSFYEGLGVVAIEAQAAGLPCYVSDRVPQEVKVTENCFFLPIDEVDKWTDSLCAKQPVRANQMSNIIASGYDIEDTALWLSNFYKSLLIKK